MNDGWRWFPYLGHRKISEDEALEMFDITLPKNNHISALTFEWFHFGVILFGKIKENNDV